MTRKTIPHLRQEFDLNWYMLDHLDGTTCHKDHTASISKNRLVSLALIALKLSHYIMH